MRPVVAALALAVLGAGEPAQAATPLALVDRDQSIALSDGYIATVG